MGCAAIAQRSVIPAIISSGRFELVAVASRNPEKAAKYAAQFKCKAVTGYENLLHEPLDAVYMPLPTGLHEEWVIKCVERGLHVFSEKSFSLNFASTQKMLGLARHHTCVVMENFMFAYHTQHQYLLRLLAEGIIGELRNFTASFAFPPLPAGNFRYDPATGGGALLDAGAYTVKAASLILGPELKLVSSVLFMGAPGQADTRGTAMFTYQDKIPVQLNWGFDHFYQCGYEIWGTKGKITTHRSFTGGPGFQPTLVVETPGETRQITLPACNHFENILGAFANYIVTNDFETPISETEKQSALLQSIFDRSLVYE